MRREGFLGALLATATLTALPRAAYAAVDDFRLGCALVLSGGGARGAYEVGAIAEMVREAGVRDGEPFPGIDVVCGTSIGALIGYFFATAQYTKLFRIWDTISRYDFFEVKQRYRAIVQQESGIGTRVIKALRLVRGLTHDEKGVLDGDHFSTFVDSLVRDNMPIITPFACTATSLTRQSATLFYAVPVGAGNPNTARNLLFRRALALTAGSRLDVREAGSVLLAQAIRASATIPILLDPIEIDGPYGTEAFIDGGIADNTPIDIARALSKRLKVMIVDSASGEHNTYANALQIGLGAFEIAQRRILDTSLRAAAVDTVYGGVYPVDIEILQPAQELPLQLLDFDHRADIEHVMQLGADDARRGFTAYRL